MSMPAASSDDDNWEGEPVPEPELDEYAEKAKAAHARSVADGSWQRSIDRLVKLFPPETPLGKCLTAAGLRKPHSCE